MAGKVPKLNTDQHSGARCDLWLVGGGADPDLNFLGKGRHPHLNIPFPLLEASVTGYKERQIFAVVPHLRGDSSDSVR